MALVAPGFVAVPPKSGGAVERYVVQLCAELRRAGLDSYVIARKSSDSDISHGNFVYLNPKVQGRLNVPASLRYALEVRRYVNQNGFDIVHLQGGIAAAIQSIILRNLNLAKVLTVHNMLLFSQKRFTRAVSLALESLSCHMVDRVVVVAQSMSAMLHTKMPGKAIDYIPNGAYISPEQPDRDMLRHRYGYEDWKVLLCVARFVPEKGILFLVRSVGKLITDFGESKLALLLVGPPGGDFSTKASSYSRTVVEEIHSLGLDSSVRYLGMLGTSQLEEIYTLADLFVLPSLVDAQPVVVLEAISRNLPVVATNVGGIPDMIRDGVTGWLVPPGDAQALARVVQYVLSHGPRVQEVTSNAHDLLLSQFSWERVSGKLVELYTSLLRERTSRPDDDRG